jgi:hypothetical protein
VSGLRCAAFQFVPTVPGRSSERRPG